MTRTPNVQLTHVGVQVRDLDQMIAFYQKTLGLVLTDRGEYYLGGEIAFMSRNANEHHQLVVASGRKDDPETSPINQISFRVDSLEDLITYYKNLLADQVPIQRTITHGNAWSIYFFDPDGNRVELYCVTPWYVEQPYGIPIDLNAPISEIMKITEDLIKDNPTKISQEQWSNQLKAKIFN
jgi:catechol 2,3-dioxygenase-like lactoylglutathione lyase family enzyme